MHSTFNLDDGYMGSGKYLWNAIRKHGIENFKKEILEFLPDRCSLKIREKELISSLWQTDCMCMNLRPDGEGGFISVENQRIRSIAGGLVHKRKMETDTEYMKECSNRMRNTIVKLHNEGKIKVPDKTGTKHSEETKEKMRLSACGKHAGEKNSQFGFMWIHNISLKQNKKIKKDESIPEGWNKGRKMKFE
jgi:hypothetical protein